LTAPFTVPFIVVSSTMEPEHHHHHHGHHHDPPQQYFTPQSTQGHVLCCLCGISIPPNPSNMCVNCIRNQVDITEGIQKQVTILWCKMCGRYLQPPKHWLLAEQESKELLTFCIKRIRGMQKVKLIDAGFIWTEPHSMRLKVKLTVQAEVMNGAILQQSFVVEFVVERHMCPTCNRQNANPNSWIACVQVRQHVQHKRTFFFLEQLILKHGVDQSCVNVKNIHEGVDFYFGNRAHANKFVDFLQSVVPIRYRSDKQLVSHDIHTSNYNYKYTFSAELSPVCKDDLVCLPPKVATSHGGIGPVVLCTRVTNALTMICPKTLQTCIIEAAMYWKMPFKSMMSGRQLMEFIVLDVEPVQAKGCFGNSKMMLAECVVARAADFGSNDQTYITYTHLGHVLHPGDHAMGYDVANANLVDGNLDNAEAKGYQLMDIVLVRKSYEERRRRRRAKGVSRAWKLKRMDMELGEDEDEGGKGGKRRNGELSAAEQEAADMERFLEELEEDADLRSRIAIYKDSQAAAAAAAAANSAMEHDGMGDHSDGDDGDDGDDLPEIPLEELLDDLAAMHIQEDD
jgi:nonsense-mediated mRNA decay protein 3